MPLCDLSAERAVQLFYELEGPYRKDWAGEQHETVLLLLGSAEDLRKRTTQMYRGAVGGFFRVLTYDHRNTGRSTILDEACSMDDYADDAAALISALLPNEAEGGGLLVIGVSFGGMVAQHLAIRHPQLVRKLVLCCCGAGGSAGKSAPIQDWYAPGVTVEDRAFHKTTMANAERTEVWRKTNAREWQTVYSLVLLDERVGQDEPNREEGLRRQLEARRLHDTEGRLRELEMPVLCCGSRVDGISPPRIMQAMAGMLRYGQLKLDFVGGHAFLVADPSAMPFVNAWLRGTATAAVHSADFEEEPSVQECPDACDGELDVQLWQVVGGGDKGGIIVREAQDLKSTQMPERLATGALVKELDLVGERLSFERLQGEGPRYGWVSVSLKGSPLLRRVASE